MKSYQKARELVQAVKAEESYKEFIQAREQVFADPKLKDMLRDLRKAEIEAHQSQLEGKELSDQEKEKIQKLYELARMNSVLAGYLEKEYRFSMMMMDIQKIINEVIPEEKEQASDSNN